MSSDKKFAFQKLDVYIVSKALMNRVQDARIADAELRDQATRAAKSQFLNLVEGLPFGTKAKRRRYFEDAQRSLTECVGNVDGAYEMGAIDRADVDAIFAMAHRVDAMLRGLRR